VTTSRPPLLTDPRHAALLVIDMQRAFVDPGQAMEVPAARAVIPQIQDLIAAFRAHGRPVVFTEFVYSEAAPLLVGDLHPEHRRAAPGAATGFGLPSSSCLDGEDNVETVADLKPGPGELVVRKHYYDAFNGTALDARRPRRRPLAIAGTMTAICVLATVIGAFNREHNHRGVGRRRHPLARDPARDPRHRGRPRRVATARGHGRWRPAPPGRSHERRPPFTGCMPANLLPFRADPRSTSARTARTSAGSPTRAA
jgi:ureidoacrylate peracid hydrolase